MADWRCSPDPNAFTLAVPLTIHQVAPSLRSVGGHAYTVPGLAGALAARHEVVIHTLEPPRNGQQAGYAVTGYPASKVFRRLGASRPMKVALYAAGRAADVVHSHGLWLRTDAYAARAARRGRARLVVSPRGTLDPWAIRHHWGRKRALWYGWQRRALREAACLHATAEQERVFFRALGFQNPVAVVPNGVHVPELGPDGPPPEGPRRLLYLARIHPKKGILNLVSAWKEVEPLYPEWELCVAGPDDGGHLPAVQALAERLSVQRLRFLGFVPEEEKGALIRSAELYTLPTHNENWGVSIADALAYGVPAIVGRGAPWSGLNAQGCGWWVDNDVPTLAETLREALALSPADLRARGERGREWVREEFSWARVGEMMEGVYRWVVEGGAPPPWVHVS